MKTIQKKDRPNTPMMRQYYEIKDQHPDDIVFFRLGDFYEMFESDADIASKELDITLTGRGKDENRISMCGVPFHAAEAYIHKLVHKGYRVAICEQTEEATQGAGLTKREVVQVLTPGTLMTGDEQSQTYYLASLYHDEKLGLWGFGAVDISTGHCVSYQAESKDTLDLALGRLPIKEWLIPFGLQKQQFGLTNDDSVQVYSAIDADHAEKQLKEWFSIKDLSVFDCDQYPVSFPALVGLIDYTKRMQQHDCEQIQRIYPISFNQKMQLDTVTAQHLELVLPSDEKSRSLFSVLNACKTTMGKRRLKELILSPFSDANTINSRLDAVDTIRQDMIAKEEIRSVLSQVSDLERLIARVVSGMNNPRDMIALRQSLSVLMEMDGIFQALSGTLWEDYGSFFAQFQSEDSVYRHCLTLLSQAFRDEVPAVCRDGGFIRPGFSDELDELLQSFQDVRQWVEQLEKNEKERTGIKSLKVRFNKVFGYYIEVSKSVQDQVPSDYVRKQTLANAERYITAELKDKEQLLLSGEERQKALEINIYNQIVSQCREWVRPLQECAKVVADIDTLQSLGHIAQKYRYCRPTILNDDSLSIQLEASRHPVLERLSDQSFIPNSISMNKESHFALITGPNMAGKSTVMRQVALTTIMAQMGSFVPAKKATLSLVDKCFTRIGASDKLGAGQSTFMVEMVETARIINNATPNSLLILDEIGRGTSTFDGISIAAAVSRYIIESIGARSFFATHYHELTELSEKYTTCHNFSMAISETDDRLVFKYQLVAGAADKSYGLTVAKMAGLPQTVIDTASQTLAHLESHAVNGLSPNHNGNQLSLFES